jgi:hypothetical protein
MSVRRIVFTRSGSYKHKQNGTADHNGRKNLPDGRSAHSICRDCQQRQQDADYNGRLGRLPFASGLSREAKTHEARNRKP